MENRQGVTIVHIETVQGSTVHARLSESPTLLVLRTPHETCVIASHSNHAPPRKRLTGK